MLSGFPSAKESLVLSLLAEHGDLYGLQLVAFAQGQLKRGTIYVTLGRMQDKGLVRTLQDASSESHAGMPRPLYRITALGSRALRAVELAARALRPSRSKA
jgi:PadR family transcriptional regulator, regulatory protein PadR